MGDYGWMDDRLVDRWRMDEWVDDRWVNGRMDECVGDVKTNG